MKAIAGAMVLLLSGCVTLPKAPESRAEWDAIHSRTFQAPQQQVSDAADKVLRLADGDFKIDYPPNQLIGTRPWMVYAVLAIASGVDYWKLDFQPHPDGSTKATLQISRAAGVIGPAPTAMGDVSVSSNSVPGQPIPYPAPYALFWQRVEYELGLRSGWPTCKAFLAGMDRGSKAGADALCSVNTDDRAPTTE